MPSYHFYPMTKDKAVQISKWKYREPYAFYDMDDSEECIFELLHEDYFYGLNAEGALSGFICKGCSARVPGGYAVGIYDQYTKVMDIGIGLTPDFTGQGKGRDFLTDGLNFLHERYKVNHFQLVVAGFNQRAIKVYERIGFEKGTSFKSSVNGQEISFTVMNLSIGRTE